ncbi:unnamed protein product [Diatraea saccharalis]|uniref:Uncharacterized protein n=1 Tax=Diatraea saccharalis TaxID=40085 RepID=A0A9N9REU8_9NEOP|nr:unnamed protein product [Diatraea saccharalis]
MSNNNIKIFNNEKTNNLTYLTNLVLNVNKISEIKLSYFENLINVELNNNNISYINSTTFENLRSLEYIDLSINEISEIPPGTFQHLTSLTFLNLSSNFITNLRYGSFRGLTNIKILDLSMNKITSLDVTVFHECIGLEKLVIDYNMIKNINVDGLMDTARNLSSLSLGGNPIACEEIVRGVQLNEKRKIQITSINQHIYEDNVHGIKCGNTNYYSSSTEMTLIKSVDKNMFPAGVGNSTTTILLTWCAVTTILVLFAMFGYFYYIKRHMSIPMRRDYFRNNSLNISSIDNHTDLLS